MSILRPSEEQCLARNGRACVGAAAGVLIVSRMVPADQ